jgi:hypothetical protein
MGAFFAAGNLELIGFEEKLNLGGKMKKTQTLRMAIFPLLLLFFIGCAGIPVRDEVKVDMKAPVGKIEGNQFTGIRYPFNVSAPPGWQVTTKYPEFMLKLGFDKEGLEESEVFVFNPVTQSHVQIDFTPAGRYSTFDQPKMEWLTNAAGGSFESEFRKDYGKNVPFEISATEPYSLKGVPFAARRYTTYAIRGINREHGWVYAFAEPYQIFIIYMILEKEGSNDHQAIKAILDSFEVVTRK